MDTVSLKEASMIPFLMITILYSFALVSSDIYFLGTNNEH